MTDRDDLDPTEAARLRDALARLPQEIDPERDLWPEIRARIDVRRVRALPTNGGSLPWYSAPRRLVAAAAVLVFVSASVTWYSATHPSRSQVEASEALSSFGSFERSAADLSATLEQRSARLDPRTRAVLERSLRTIDGAIAEAREALATDPANPAIRAFVEAAYRQKIDFLRRANDVAAIQGS